MKNNRKSTLLCCLLLVALMFTSVAHLPGGGPQAVSVMYWQDAAGVCQSRMGGIGSIDIRDNLLLVGQTTTKWNFPTCKSNWDLPGIIAGSQICIDLNQCPLLLVLAKGKVTEFYARPSCRIKCPK